jgi:hypothetical protein
MIAGVMSVSVIKKNNFNGTVCSYRSLKVAGTVSFPATKGKKSLAISFIAGELEFQLEIIA